MAEKAELPSDQVSLPPTYAPSEAFTDSPPPAYKRTGMAAVKVAKIVSVTVLLMTLLIGSAVVAHKWIQLKECDCSHKLETAPQPLSLVSLSGPDHVTDLQEESLLAKNFVALGESELNENALNAEEEEEEIKEMKKLRLPIDMLLGNPSLAGKNMPCNVEKKRQKIADGIFTEAVIVTCENEDKMDLPFFPLSPPDQAGPPMSLLSHIMKALASRPRPQMGPREDPEDVVPRQFRKRPFPFGNPIPFPMRNGDGPPKPFPFTAPGMVHVVPMNHFNPNNPPQVMSSVKEIPMSFPPPSMQQPFIKRISIRPMNQNQNAMQNIDINPILRMLPKSMMMPNHLPEMRDNPMQMPDGPKIKIIRIHSNEEPTNGRQERQFPVPMNPMMKIFPIRKAKVMQFRPTPIPDHEAVPNFIEDQDYEQFQRPIEIINHLEDIVEENVPQASGRSLPSPRVELPPGIKLLRLPNPPPFMRFPDGPPMTHMEMRRAPSHMELPEGLTEQIAALFPPPVLPAEQEEEAEEFGPPRTHTVLQSAPEPIFRSESAPIVIGEPRLDGPQPFETDIEPDFRPETEPLSLSQMQSRVFVPPPRFAREGRFSPLAEINPEAEVYSGPHHHEEVDNHHVILN